MLDVKRAIREIEERRDTKVVHAIEEGRALIKKLTATVEALESRDWYGVPSAIPNEALRFTSACSKALALTQALESLKVEEV